MQCLSSPSSRVSEIFSPAHPKSYLLLVKSRTRMNLRLHGLTTEQTWHRLHLNTHHSTFTEDPMFEFPFVMFHFRSHFGSMILHGEGNSPSSLKISDYLGFLSPSMLRVPSFFNYKNTFCFSKFFFKMVF